MINRFERFRMVPMILVMGTIFFLSHQSGDSLPIPLIPGLDKLAHCIIYSVLAVTVVLAFGRQRRLKQPMRVFIFTLFICLGYGMSDELHQSFIPGRYVSGGDLLADISGALLVCAVWYVSLRGRRT